MKKEQLQRLVDQSDLSGIPKNVMTGFLERSHEAFQRSQQDRELIEAVAREKRVEEVVVSTDEVKIYTVGGNHRWSVNYPYRSIFRDQNGTWKNGSSVSPTLEIAFLDYLQTKYLGMNSQFAQFAVKMLGIPPEQAELKG